MFCKKHPSPKLLLATVTPPAALNDVSTLSTMNMKPAKNRWCRTVTIKGGKLGGRSEYDEVPIDRSILQYRSLVDALKQSVDFEDLIYERRK